MHRRLSYFRGFWSTSNYPNSYLHSAGLWWSILWCLAEAASFHSKMQKPLFCSDVHRAGVYRNNGESGIRTRDTVACIHDFQKMAVYLATALESPNQRFCIGIAPEQNLKIWGQRCRRHPIVSARSLELQHDCIPTNHSRQPVQRDRRIRVRL